MPVGARVGVPFGTPILPGEVIEDRGDLGIGGRQIVRIRFNVDPDVVVDTERPAEELLPPPDPDEAPPRSRRRTARRPASA